MDSESVTRREINDGSDHPEPDIRSNDSDGFKDEAPIADKDIAKALDEYPITDTNMHFSMFADPAKLVPEEELRPFMKEDKPTPKHEEYSDDSDVDDYVRTSRETPAPPTPEPSKFGPSYGSGRSYPSGGGGYREDDDDDEFESENERMLAKLDMLRKLGELTQHGVKLSQNYNMESDYKAMKYEYELHRSIRDKHNGVKWLSNMMLNIVYGVELANEKFDPFNFKLKGWSEQMNEDIDDYYDVFGELYEKYFKAGKPIPPELKLFFMISASAIKFHMTKAMMSNMPNMADMMAQNPGMADQLRQQAQRQNQAYQQHAQTQHEEMRKRAEDIEMLNRMREEKARQDFQNQKEQLLREEMQRKEMRISELQNQLNAQQSDTRSSVNRASRQPTMKPPTIPASLRNSYISPTQQQMEREEEIKQQYNQMRQELDKDNRSNDSSVDMDDNMDDIIRRGVARSRVSDGETVDSNRSVSDGIVKKNKRRRRKPGISIRT